MKLDLRKTFVVLQPDLSSVPVEVTPGIYEELDRRFERFKGRTLVSCHTFDADWPTWERHPAGDEVVCLVSGEVHMVLDRGGREEGVRLSEPGSCVLVPKGTWHTARMLAKPCTLLFITPGEGTENRDIGK